MDEVWRNIFGIWIQPLGAGPVRSWPGRVQNSFYTNIIMLYIKSKVMKRRIQWCKNLPWGHDWGVTRGQKIGFWVLFFFYYCHSTPPRRFELEP